MLVPVMVPLRRLAVRIGTASPERTEIPWSEQFRAAMAVYFTDLSILSCLQIGVGARLGQLYIDLQKGWRSGGSGTTSTRSSRLRASLKISSLMPWGAE